MKKIEEEVKKRESSVDPLVLQNNTFQAIHQQKNLQTSKLYILEDFVHYYDEAFINNAYHLILKRNPDNEGKAIYLQQLRLGERSKTEILTSLYYSKEAKENGVVILGMKKRYLLSLIYKLPLLGYIAKIIINIITLPKLIKRINHHETQTILKLDTNKQEIISQKQEIISQKQEIISQKQEIANNKQTLLTVLQELDAKLKIELATKTDTKEFESYLKTVEYAKEYMRESQAEMQKLIDHAKEKLPTGRENPLLKSLEEAEKHKFDALYVEFEDKFRGERTDIKQRLSVYLPYLEKLSFRKEEIELVDVGCGRGEWLELLSDNGYKAHGIDLNKIMVATAQSLGFDVKAMDVIEYLKSLKDDSLNVITGFHIIEHLPFEVLMRMYEESYRVLKKGGMIIFETPNPENLLVAAHHFYTDPTHINPLVPITTEFLVQQCGFKNTEIKRLHKYGQYHTLIIKNEFMEKHFNSEMDYAIIGYKI